MTISEVSDDPFAEHVRRDPLPDAGIRIILLTHFPVESAERIIASLADLVVATGRSVERSIVTVGEDGLGRALERGLVGATLPLVLVTTAEEPWTNDHLKPLLEAINQCDHVIGCRPARVGRWSGLLGRMVRRLIFAVPLRDIHSPCRLHRLDKLLAIPLQSASSFLDTEIVAKATFLGHLIDEVAVPSLQGYVRSTGWLTDMSQVLGHPVFVRSSGPSEETQCEREGNDGPGSENEQRSADLEHARPLEQHAAQGVDQLREREGFDEGLGGVGKPVGGEEHPGEEPHRQHDQVHQAAHCFGGPGATGDEQADTGKRECTQHVDGDHESQAAPDRHLEHQRSQQQEDREVGDDEGQPGREQGEQEIAAGHRRGHEPLEQFRDAKVDEQKADAPQATAHGVQADQARDQKVDVP